jgi:hypothetical protein
MQVGRFFSLGGAAALALATALTLAPSLAGAESQLKDSDDYNCNHGSLDDPATLTACQHLRGGPVTIDEVAAARQMGFQRSSDDYNCHHARRGTRRRIAACHRLHGY